MADSFRGKSLWTLAHAKYPWQKSHRQNSRSAEADPASCGL